MAVSTSSRSKKPSDTCSPSERPEPEKSMEKTVMPQGRSCRSSSHAAMRQEALPWR